MSGMIDFFVKLLFGLFLLGMITVPILFTNLADKANLELQTILKNECGMEYTVPEVWRNGENLSRICGLKKTE